MKDFISQNNITIKNGMVTYMDLFTNEEISKEFIVNLDSIHNKMCAVNYLKEYQSVRHIKNSEIETKSIMPFAFAYYYFFVRHLQIPFPKEFINQYLTLFCYKKDNGKWAFKPKYNTTGNSDFEFGYNSLKARILRSYNSFNREIELLVNLCRQDDIKIEYDLYKDLYNGVDITIIYNNHKVGIAEYVNTERSKNFKSKKNNIHKYEYDNITMIDVMANFDNDNKNITCYGEVYCYDDSVITKLKKDIDRLCFL